MTGTRFRYTLAAVLTVLAIPPGMAAAQHHHTENTLAYSEDARRPSATLADIAWLAGHWQGEALGGLSEEVWTPPLGGTMMGMYKLAKGDSIVFYELLTMIEESGSIELRLKHFNADLTGWEEQNEVVHFPLVKRDEGKIYFDGMTFERLGPDSVRIFVAIRGKDGSFREEPFVYRRVASGAPSASTGP